MNYRASYADDFWRFVYSLCEAGDLQEATNWIMETFDVFLRGGHFELANVILERANFSQLHTATMRAALVVTKVAKAKLSARQKFFEASMDAAKRRRGDAVAERLFGKLE